MSRGELLFMTLRSATEKTRQPNAVTDGSLFATIPFKPANRDNRYKCYACLNKSRFNASIFTNISIFQ